MTTKYKIKNLAQKLPGQGTIQPGIYEFSELGSDVINHQKKLKNLIEIEEKVESSIVLKLKVEDTNKPTTKRNRKTRRNIDDYSN